MTRQEFSAAELHALARLAGCSRFDVHTTRRKRSEQLETDGLLRALEDELTSELLACVQAEENDFLVAQRVISVRCILHDITVLSRRAVMPLLMRVTQNMDGDAANRAALLLSHLLSFTPS
tara:strand:- start:3478 stop:3840 length:363 start_codon:yes stop_codon:yes gene_type:complete